MSILLRGSNTRFLSTAAVALQTRAITPAFSRLPAVVTSRTFSSSKDPAKPESSSQGGLEKSETQDEPVKPLGKVSGIVNSILHGSGTLPKIQSQESWGVSLARGKYVHELQSKSIPLLADQLQ